MDISLVTTSDEDRQGMDLIGEAFERAVIEASCVGCPYCGKQFPVLGDLDLDTLWNKILEVIGAST